MLCEASSGAPVEAPKAIRNIGNTTFLRAGRIVRARKKERNVLKKIAA
jgi:hypothetical protein